MDRFISRRARSVVEPTGKFHIITGAPGSGKTSLIDALSSAGFHHMPEAGRAIIKDQVAIDGTALPWADQASFAELMLGWDMRSHGEASDLSGPIFFDRGIPDLVVYLNLCGIPVPRHMIRAAELCRYNKRVFIAPYWPEIFVRDKERKQSTLEAEATFEALVQAYTDLSYDLVRIPCVPVAERVEFILANV